jgi:Chlorophyll A-B binding protein
VTSSSEHSNEEKIEKNDSANDPQTPTFGWSVYAEKMNGRFAMIGFVGLLLLEWFTRQDFFTWLGF